MMRQYLQFLLISVSLFFVSGCNEKLKFEYRSDKLTLNNEYIKDSLRIIYVDSLPGCHPVNNTSLAGANKMTDRLWNIALENIESNIIKTEDGEYFGAGQNFGLRIYTRDISYSGILGVNSLYPRKILNSLKVTRNLRLGLGLRVSEGHMIHGLSGNWVQDSLSEKEFLKKYRTNCYTRRTDDVVWLWAAMDLFEKHPELADWQWIYDNGKNCFDKLYDPFFDPTDGLYRGQASFIDIHFMERKASGYPQDFSVEECVMIKSTSTNCLYYKGLLSMASAAKKLNKPEEASEWLQKAKKLKQAIVSNLRFEDSTFAYFKHTNGELEQRRDAFGAALAVVTGIVEGDDALKAIAGYPVSWAGVPLFYPFYPGNASYHNNTAWPFVDTFFLWAKEKAEGKDYTSFNAALLARTCVKDGSFHEVVNWSTKNPMGSGSQLWSASAFVNVCRRADLFK